MPLVTIVVPVRDGGVKIPVIPTGPAVMSAVAVGASVAVIAAISSVAIPSTTPGWGPFVEPLAPIVEALVVWVRTAAVLLVAEVAVTERAVTATVKMVALKYRCVEC